MNINNATQRDIMHYESDIWSIADSLLAAGIKQSNFPTYMMPFFCIGYGSNNNSQYSAE